MPDATPNRSLALAAVVGLVAGVLSGLFGIGGGVVLVPALVLFFALPQLQASAVSLAAIATGAGAGIIPFALDGEVDWLPGIVLAAGAIVGSLLSTRLVSRIPERVLAWAFVVVVVAAAIRMLVPGGGGGGSGIELTPATASLLAVVGLGAGFTAVTLGLGGGIIYVPSLAILWGLDQHTAQGTSLVAIVPAAIVGALGHARSGRMDWRLAGVVATGSFLGGYAGGELAQLIAAERLRIAFGLLLVILAVRMAVSTTRRGSPPTTEVPWEPPA